MILATLFYASLCQTKNFTAMKNLALLFERSDKSGLSWYAGANDFVNKVAANYSLPVDRVAAVVSTLSPGTNWEQNKKDSINLIESMSGNRRKFKFTTYGQNVVKAFRILDENAIPESYFSLKTGPKTLNFFYNLWQPDNPDFVTIDRHAYTVATGEQYIRLTVKQYRDVAEHYMRAAKRLDILPNQLQSTLWVDYRKKQDIKFAEFCPF